MRFPQADYSLNDRIQGLYPVGSLFVSVLAANPADQLGFGTWEAFAPGRVLVGVDPSDPDFDAAEKTSGAKTVTLTEAQMPAHTHAVNDPGHTHVEQTNSATTGGLTGWTARDTSTNNPSPTDYSTASATTGITLNNAGGGAAHPNVQPSIAVFIWRRVS